MAPRKSSSESSNPDALMRDAILHALDREAEDADGRAIRKLQLVAERLVDKAVDGDLAAIKEVIARIDGRVAQPIAPVALSLEDFLDRLDSDEQDEPDAS